MDDKDDDGDDDRISYCVYSPGKDDDDDINPS